MRTRTTTLYRFVPSGPDLACSLAFFAALEALGRPAPDDFGPRAPNRAFLNPIFRRFHR